MKKSFTLLLIVGALLLTSRFSYSQCSTTNATGCACQDGSNDCDLLPDMTISWFGLSTYLGGPTEYSQTGNGVDDGRLKVSGSTPNIGYGPFNVLASGLFVCGSDTFTSYPGTCSDGSAPKQIIRQRIYHKSGNTMTSWIRDALAGTYEAGSPTIHVDDWGIFTLRLQNPNEIDPRNWSILATGHKRSFCLMDYGSCTSYNGHCRDDNTVYNQGNILTNSSFPNYGLGGGTYGCSDLEQGISSGYTDIYSENLNQMWLRIPPGTCNGNYWIVYEIDPHNYFLESNELNNYTAIPVTLTLQDTAGNPKSVITADRYPVICGTDSIQLTANAGYSYLWSNGSTSQSIMAGIGTYSVTVTSPCGTATSQPINILSSPAPSAPNITASSDSICSGNSVTLQANGSSIVWLNSLGQQIATGNTFTSPLLNQSTTYFAEDIVVTPGLNRHTGKPNYTGTGGYYNAAQGLLFEVKQPLLLKSVEVYANGDGIRTIEVTNSAGDIIQSGSFMILDGHTQVNLNFLLPAGTGYTISATGAPNLYRNDAGVTYPYEITDTISITGSTAGASYYYFFYNWEVEIFGNVCVSPQTAKAIEVVSCTGVGNFYSENGISIYPNPATDVVTVSVNHDFVYPPEISIMDATGRLLMQIKIDRNGKSWKQNISMSGLSSGIYWFIIHGGDQRYYRKVIVR